MKVVVDDKIPFIRKTIEQLADDVIYRPGAQISPEDIHDADALIIRTRTKCNAKLLADSSLKFIATATIGFDHLDTEYLKHRGITWANCPGCNANSVAQYIYSCLLLLEKEKKYDLSRITIGLIGVGHVGGAVKQKIAPLGVRILLNDPLREAFERKHLPPEERETFLSLDELKKECDIISFHTPLVRQGDYPTFHLADRDFLFHLEKRPLIINTSRGEVIDNEALLQALQSGTIRDAIIDTWENEPEINRDLLQKVYIGTPHIAGYSADGKANATRMALHAFCQYFHLPTDFRINPPDLPKNLCPSTDLKELALQLYNPHTDSIQLKMHPETFEELRGNYPLRREFI